MVVISIKQEFREWAFGYQHFGGSAESLCLMMFEPGKWVWPEINKSPGPSINIREALHQDILRRVHMLKGFCEHYL